MLRRCTRITYLLACAATLLLVFTAVLAHADAVPTDVFAPQNMARTLTFTCCNNLNPANVKSLDVDYSANVTFQANLSMLPRGCQGFSAAAKVVIDCSNANLAAGDRFVVVTTPDTSTYSSACWDPNGQCIGPATPAPEPPETLMLLGSGIIGLFQALRMKGQQVARQRATAGRPELTARVRA